MKAKLWNIEFGTYDSIVVNASNAKEAMLKSISKLKGMPFCRLQDITEISLIAIED